MSRAAASARQSKDKHPERYCPNPRCLWRTANWNHKTQAYGFRPCPNHQAHLDFEYD